MNTSFLLKPDERASFLGEPRLITVGGPITLMRVVGRTASGEANNPFGRYWFNEQFFWSVIDFLSDHSKDVPLINHYIKLVMRDGLAVCHDWNSFATVRQLRVPAGKELHAYVGLTKPQPKLSTSSHKNTTAPPSHLLLGGEVQYIVDVNHAVRSYVSGPIPMRISGIGHA
jgi:hypothetical protein